MTHRTTTTPGLAQRCGIAFSAALLPLLAVGCTEDDVQDPDAADETAAEESPAEENGQGEALDEEDEAQQGPENEAAGETGDSEEHGEQAQDDPQDPSALTVDSVGGSPYGLVTEDKPDAETEEFSGELIIGPGGYMALEHDAEDPPQVLVFGEEIEFTLAEGRPSVTIPDLGVVEVGEDFDVMAAEVPLEDLDGIPNDRLDEAADTALIVFRE